MPPTDGFDELALMRCRGECGWSSSTATSASSRLRIGADRRSAMRSVSRARAWCLAAPTARRSTESAGARTCSSRSQVRARASSEAVRSSSVRDRPQSAGRTTDEGTFREGIETFTRTIARRLRDLCDGGEESENGTVH